jgi:hypothetical protein
MQTQPYFFMNYYVRDEKYMEKYTKNEVFVLGKEI